MKFLGIPIPFVREPVGMSATDRVLLEKLIDKRLEQCVENELLKTRPRRAIRKDAGAYKDAKQATTTRLAREIGRPSIADHVDTINAGRARAA